MHRPLALLAVPALLTAAGTTAACDGAPAPPTGGGALVLRLNELPGMVPPGGTAAIPPSFSLFGDGRLVSVATGASGGWPRLRESTVPDEGVRDLYGDAAALRDRPTENPDEPVVRVVVGSADGRRTVTLPRSDPSATRLRAALAAYANASATEYRPAAVAVIATPADPAEPARPWPLPRLSGEPLPKSAGSTCLVLRGADLDAVRRATADAGARWRSEGRVWQVRPRPLLPDETGCADL
ncbi:hypothetical protein [Micromonospora globbae]|uniref:hypothetical protein n=1 Tax=Micromonospora globbae TaxID=1894969 RepID=UPI0038656A4D|nr:hypothetical protein OH732_11120 [Micromonospora globbae]